MLLSAPLIIPPYEIMQLQTSIRSCEGNHYVVTVINDAAENSGLLSNNSCAQGAFEGRGPVAKETDEIQNGPRATVLLSSPFSLFLTNKQIFFLPLSQSFLPLFWKQLSRGFFFPGLWECLCPCWFKKRVAFPGHKCRAFNFDCLKNIKEMLSFLMTWI